MTFNGVLFKTINYIKIFIKHMLFSYVFWTIFGLTKLLDFIYIYIYTYIAKIFYSTRQNETTSVYNIDYLDFEGLAPLSKKKR